MTRSRRACAATGSATLLSTAVLAFGPGIAPVSAEAAPGSGLGYFSLAARATGVQARIREPNFCFGSAAGQNGCELVQPEATSTLRNGPLGKGVAAIVWPGALAADIGSLIITASDGQVPAEARMLNDPIRATAETNTSHETASYDSVPGTSMHASAKAQKTTADASVESSQVTPIGSFGKTTGSSMVELTGPAEAKATGHSKASDINLGGVVKIDSVTSDVVATTDGTTGKATGKTVVSGMTIANQPVTVDGDGVHVAGNSPLPLQVAQAAVNTALANAGMKILLGPPASHVDGASVDYTAGSLVIFWAPQAGNEFTVTLGGASVSVDSAPALADFVPPATGGTTDQPAVQQPVAPVVSGITGIVDSAPPPTVGGAPTVDPVTAPDTGVVEAPVLASRKVSLPDGLSPAYAILGTLGSMFLMLGLRRLPDRLLEATPSLCLLEENR